MSIEGYELVSFQSCPICQTDSVLWAIFVILFTNSWKFTANETISLHCASCQKAVVFRRDIRITLDHIPENEP